MDFAGSSYIPTPNKKRESSHYTGSLIITKRPKMTTNIEIGEFTRFKRTLGRKKRQTVRRAHQLIKANYNPWYLRATGSNPYCTVAAGYFKIYNHYNTTGRYHLPVHIWNLTPGCNHGDYSKACYLPYLEGSTLKIGLQNVVAPSGGVNNSFDVESAATEGAYADQQVTKMWHRWSDIRLLCYGTTKVPIKYDIMIVKFWEEMHNPAWIYEFLSGAASGNAQTVRFFEWLAQDFVRSPVDIKGAYEQSDRVMKVMHHESFVIQGTTSIEASNTVPHMKSIKIFQKQDMLLNHRYKPTTVQAVGSYATSLYNVDNDNVYVDPHWKERLFLVIRAQAVRTDSAADPTFDVTKNPSYDLTIRHRVDLPES